RSFFWTTTTGDKMTSRSGTKFWIGLALAVAAHVSAFAQTPIKIGVVAPMSGAFAAYGKQIEAGINVFLRENGDSIAGRKLEIIYKDNAGPNAEAAKRLA